MSRRDRLFAALKSFVRLPQAEDEQDQDTARQIADDLWTAARLIRADHYDLAARLKTYAGAFHTKAAEENKP